MNKYKYDKKKGVYYLVVEGQKGQITTEREIYAMQNGEISGLLAPVVIPKGNTFLLRYGINGLALLRDYLVEPIDKALFSRLLSSILTAVRNVSDAVFNPASLLLDPDYLFVDPQSGEAKLVYIPIATYDCGTNLRALLQTMLSYCSFATHEDTGYVQRFFAILNDGAAFSVFTMEQYAQDLAREIAIAQGLKQCPVCSKMLPPVFGFCPECGAALQEVGAAKVNTRVERTAWLFRESTGERISVGQCLRIGKSRTNNDYCMPELPIISRNHAVIEAYDGNWFITDLGSTNGTFINGSEIQPQVASAICAGDRIRLAKEDFIFEIK